MDRRRVVKTVLEGGRPPYVPWQFAFTAGARGKLIPVFGTDDLDSAVGNHMLMLRRSTGAFTDLGGGLVRDAFGVTWDRRMDTDVGLPSGDVLPRPTLRGLALPDPLDRRFFHDWDRQIENDTGLFRVFSASFSLFERAWSMRGFENLLMDFYEHPDFVHDLFDALATFNIVQLREARRYGIDAVWFGDDWGQQRGLIMGRPLWEKFIRPPVARMYAAAHDAGLYVMNHSCGDVDELFDDLIEIGLDCANPFQPEVMDVDELLPRYRGRLSFMGGLSTQVTLPYGSADEVRAASEHLIALGTAGSYVFAPAHAVPGDVPLENLLTFIEVARGQPGFGA